MKQLIIGSTLFQCLSLVAAADAGALPDADERILVLAVETVAYCMQPTLHPEADPDAAAYLELLARQPEPLALFFKRKRLALLGLPGSSPRRRRRDDLRRRLAAAGQRWTQPVNSR